MVLLWLIIVYWVEAMTDANAPLELLPVRAVLSVGIVCCADGAFRAQLGSNLLLPGSLTSGAPSQ